jgi:hypothetical protein
MPSKTRRIVSILIVLIFIFLVPALFAQDFGLVLRQKILLSPAGNSSSGGNEYTGTVIPWLSAPLSRQWDLYISGGISSPRPGESLRHMPELYRAGVIYSPDPDVQIEAGRVPFTGILPYTMTGLFDGLSARFNLGGGQLRAGVFYTGLLHKNSAYILISPEDRSDYNNDDLYFASRRLAAALVWEQTGFLESSSALSLSGLCQFDLNGNAASLHSQYLEAKFDMPLGKTFTAGFGASLCLAEETGESPRAAFAASAELRQMIPSAMPGMLSLGGYFSSGAWNKGLGTFVPLTSQAMGKILRPGFPGIALVEGAFALRLDRHLLADFSGAYYFRTDATTYTDAGMDGGSASPLLGTELYGGLNISPFSDVAISFGGGAFFPGAGKVFKSGADIKYRVLIEAAISF